MRHWFLLATAFGGAVSDLTTVINVVVPESAKEVYPDAVIRKALATVAFRPIPIQEQLALMPFNLDVLAGFRVMREGAVILTEGPSDNLDLQPSNIISIGAGGPTDPSERGMFARGLLNSEPLRDLSLQSSEPMRIGGFPGFETRAQARAFNGSVLSLV